MGTIFRINVEFRQLFRLLQIGIFQLQQSFFLLYINGLHFIIIYY
jgi:hypothetical protein